MFQSSVYLWELVKARKAKMAQNLVMRQLDERQTEHEIRLLVYSPKMDILALGLATGAVSLYR